MEVTAALFSSRIGLEGLSVDVEDFSVCRWPQDEAAGVPWLHPAEGPARGYALPVAHHPCVRLHHVDLATPETLPGPSLSIVPVFLFLKLQTLQGVLFGTEFGQGANPRKFHSGAIVCTSAGYAS